MKTSFAVLLALALVTLTGCNQGTPGGSGVTNPPQKQPAYGEAEKTFKLSVPRMSTTLHQGETKEVEVGIERGKNFELTFRTSALDYPRISFGAKLRGAVRYRRSSARWLDAVTERQLP